MASKLDKPSNLGLDPSGKNIVWDHPGAHHFLVEVVNLGRTNGTSSKEVAGNSVPLSDFLGSSVDKEQKLIIKVTAVFGKNSSDQVSKTIDYKPTSDTPPLPPGPPGPRPKLDSDDEAKAKVEKAEAEAKAKVEKAEAEAKAKVEKIEAEAKAKAEKEKAEAEAKAKAKAEKEKAEAEAKAKVKAKKWWHLSMPHLSVPKGISSRWIVGPALFIITGLLLFLMSRGCKKDTTTSNTSTTNNPTNNTVSNTNTTNNTVSDNKIVQVAPNGATQEVSVDGVLQKRFADKQLVPVPPIPAPGEFKGMPHRRESPNVVAVQYNGPIYKGNVTINYGKHPVAVTQEQPGQQPPWPIGAVATRTNMVPGCTDSKVTALVIKDTILPGEVVVHVIEPDVKLVIESTNCLFVKSDGTVVPAGTTIDTGNHELRLWSKVTRRKPVTVTFELKRR